MPGDRAGQGQVLTDGSVGWAGRDSSRGAQLGLTRQGIVVAAIALAAARVGPHVFSGATVMERNPGSHSLDFKHP